MLAEQKLMLPLWLACPNIERYSIGWRMGYGEDYKDRFFDWFDTLSVEEQTEYKKLFPEPVTWKGWWENKDNTEWFHEIQFWQKSGVPLYTREKLIKSAKKGQKQEMCLFWGHQPSKDGKLTKSCFSQWWMEEFWAVTTRYCCMEQFMMAEKARLFEDKEILEQILASNDPRQIKALGRKVKNFDETLWNQVKYSIVLNGNWYKFSQNQDLKEFLLSTGNEILVEASPYDGIWGIRLSANDEAARNPEKWNGQNLLGFALMEVREELLRVSKNEALCDKVSEM